MYFEMMPEEFIAFRNEVNEHPWLCEKLAKIPVDKDPHLQFVRMVTETATELEVIVDGDFTRKDLCKLCDLLTGELRKRRSSIITLN